MSVRREPRRILMECKMTDCVWGLNSRRHCDSCCTACNVSNRTARRTYVGRARCESAVPWSGCPGTFRRNCIVGARHYQLGPIRFARFRALSLKVPVSDGLTSITKVVISNKPNWAISTQNYPAAGLLVISKFRKVVLILTLSVRFAEVSSLSKANGAPAATRTRDPLLRRYPKALFLLGFTRFF